MLFDQLDKLCEAVRAAALRPEVTGAVARVYADLQAQIDQRKPICQLSGRCCRFDEFGHKLFVTTMELAAFVSQFGSSFPLTDQIVENIRTWDGRSCPFQIGKLCGVHPIRPFGCRLFFCDATATQWQQEQYERLHAQLKRLHEELGVPYFYVEWREAVAAVVAAGAGMSDPEA